jgi:hypothetical protein
MEKTTPIDGWKKAESLLAAERRTLEMIVGGACLMDVLENLCRAIWKGIGRTYQPIWRIRSTMSAL